MRPVFATIAFAALVIVWAGAPALADKRVALVIGNSHYANAAGLPNPVNDASDVAAMLERLGFDVTLALDQGYQDMRIALSDFADQAQGADIASVFYAGHGIEVDKQNFLIPVDARLTTDRKVRFETIALEDVLLAVEGASGLQIVILDACRENPFATTMERTGATRSIGRGLARIEPEGSSVLVAYAAREGQVAADGGGRNSPYTAALLDTIATPGVEISIVFRRIREAVMTATNRAQQPFVYQSLGAEPIYLVPGDQPAVTAPPVTQPPVQVTTPTAVFSEAAEAWAATRDTSSTAILEAFIARFGDTFYAELARARIAELAAQVAVADPVRPQTGGDLPEPIRLKAEDFFSQVQLTSLRFFNAGNDLPSPDRRRYSTTFSRGDAQYIYWEVDLEHAEAGWEVPATFEYDFYSQSGERLWRGTMDTAIEPDWATSSHWSGYGYEDAGNWTAGSYRVVVRLSGRQIAEGWFTVQ